MSELQLFACARIESPIFQGTPTVPTASGATPLQVANCSYVTQQVQTAVAPLATTANPTLTGTITVGSLVVQSTLINLAYNIATPANNGTVTIARSSALQIIQPPTGGLTVTLTIAFPPPSNGLQFQCVATAMVNKITCTCSTSATIQNAPTVMSAGISFSYIFISSLNAWVRLS